MKGKYKNIKAASPQTMTQAGHRPATTTHLYFHCLSNNIHAIAIHTPQQSCSFSHSKPGFLALLQILLWQGVPPHSPRLSQRPAMDPFCLSFTSSLSSGPTESLCTFSVLKNCIWVMLYLLPRSGKDHCRLGEGKNWTGQK